MNRAGSSVDELDVSGTCVDRSHAAEDDARRCPVARALLEGKHDRGAENAGHHDKEHPLSAPQNTDLVLQWLRSLVPEPVFPGQVCPPFGST